MPALLGRRPLKSTTGDSKYRLAALLVLVLVVRSANAAAEDGETREHGKEHTQSEEHRDGEEHEEGVIELTREAMAAAGIKLEPAAPRQFTRLVQATGELVLNPERVSRVGPRIAGRVARLTAKVGDQVQADAVLAVLESVELGRAKSDFLSRKARLELARSNHDREKRLQSKGISSEKELLEAEAGQIEAQVELDAAESTLHILGLSDPEIERLTPKEHDLSGFELRAPIRGQVIERPISLGEMAEPSTTLFVIADLSDVWAQVSIHQKDLAAVQAGSPASLSLEALPDRKIAGTIERISATLDEKTRTGQAVVVLKNGDGLLRPGMFLTARIEVPTGGRVEVLAVPEAAVQRVGNKDVVFVAEGERRFERREVRLGRVGDGYAEILEGLEPGVKVVTDGSFILKSELSKGEMGEGHAH